MANPGVLCCFVKSGMFSIDRSFFGLYKVAQDAIQERAVLKQQEENTNESTTVK